MKIRVLLSLWLPIYPGRALFWLATFKEKLPGVLPENREYQERLYSMLCRGNPLIEQAY
jgi:hypothetical protein